MPAPMSERDTGNKESLVGHASRPGLRVLRGGDKRSAPPASTPRQTPGRKPERRERKPRRACQAGRVPGPHGTHVGAEWGLQHVHLQPPEVDVLEHGVLLHPGCSVTRAAQALFGILGE